VWAGGDLEKRGGIGVVEKKKEETKGEGRHYLLKRGQPGGRMMAGSGGGYLDLLQITIAQTF